MHAHPGRHCPPAPVVTVWVRLGKGCVQGRVLLFGEQGLMRSLLSALVADTVGSCLVVAARDLADPVR
jgi:hypothetical protein